MLKYQHNPVEQVVLNEGIPSVLIGGEIKKLFQPELKLLSLHLCQVTSIKKLILSIIYIYLLSIYIKLILSATVLLALNWFLN